MSRLANSSLVDAADTAAPAASKRAGIDRRTVGVVALTVASLGILSFVLFRSINTYQNSPDTQSRYRALVDSETGQVFEDFRVPSGATFPLKNPSTGKPTLYMAEACFWTKDGKAKLTPTWVFVKETAGQQGPTMCPDCGRKVIPHNPTPPDQLMIEAAQRSSGG